MRWCLIVKERVSEVAPTWLGCHSRSIADGITPRKRYCWFPEVGLYCGMVKACCQALYIVSLLDWPLPWAGARCRHLVVKDLCRFACAPRQLYETTNTWECQANTQGSPYLRIPRECTRSWVYVNGDRWIWHSVMPALVLQRVRTHIYSNLSPVMRF